MKHNVYKVLRFFTGLFFSVALTAGVFSCSNSTGSSSEEAETGYLSFSSGRAMSDYGLSVSDLTNLVLVGSWKGGSLQTLGQWTTVNELNGCMLEVKTGSWKYALIANCSGTTNVYGDIKTVDIIAGQANSVRFDMKWVYAPISTANANIGDVVMEYNGSSYCTAVSCYVESKALFDLLGVVPEAVVFYKGSSTAIGTNRVLAVNLKNSSGDATKYQWASSGNGYTFDFPLLKCLRLETEPASGSYYSYTYNYTNFYLTGDFDGSDNWGGICAADSSALANSAICYPAFNYVLTTLGSDYYIPTYAEIEELAKNYSAVNTSIAAVGGTQLAAGAYWTSSQSDAVTNVWNVNLKPSDVDGGTVPKTDLKFTCGIRSFN